MKDYPPKVWGSIEPGDQPLETFALNPNFIEMNRGEMFLAACANILRHSYGFLETVEQGRALDKEGNDLPLYTYPAIEYLTQFDFSAKRVFEFGAGGSTIFWMKRASEVISVENNPDWVRELTPRLSANAKVLSVQGDEFPKTIRDQEGVFDVIVVDSAGYRYDCAVESVGKLAAGGMIILDNSDWHFNTAAMLKGSGLIQVDMTGFKPTYSHTSTTSIFLHREFDFSTVGNRQPAYGIGAKRIHSTDWDKPSAG